MNCRPSQSLGLLILEVGNYFRLYAIEWDQFTCCRTGVVTIFRRDKALGASLNGCIDHAQLDLATGKNRYDGILSSKSLYELGERIVIAYSMHLDMWRKIVF